LHVRSNIYISVQYLSCCARDLGPVVPQYVACICLCALYSHCTWRCSLLYVFSASESVKLSVVLYFPRFIYCSVKVHVPQENWLCDCDAHALPVFSL